MRAAWDVSVFVRVLLAAAAMAAASPGPSAIVDLEGRPADPLARAGVSVLVFTRTDCPISNRYAPELRRVQERFTPRGAAFHLVYVDAAEAVDAIREHRRAFGLGFDAVRDPEHALVGLTGATVTPEVAVFVTEGATRRMVYRGRIDDRAVDFGRTRPSPTRHDLAEVLEALAGGASPAPRTTTAVGCFIPTRP